MNLAEKYLQRVKAQIDEIEDSQLSVIETAAEWFANTIAAERLVYIFGTGHSHMLAEELFYRAGGLAKIVPMLYSPLMLHESASGSTLAERDPEVVRELMQRYPMSDGDLLVVASNSGRNACPIGLALEAKGRSVKTIAVLNAGHSARWPSRHSSGKRLGDVVDLMIDNCGVEGDACVSVSDGDLSIGAASSITGCLILQMVACRATEMLYAAGKPPDLYQSSNTNNDERNAAIIADHKPANPHL